MLRTKPVFSVFAVPVSIGARVTRERTVRRRKQREQLWEAQGKICFLCGEKMYPVSHTRADRGWSMDHVRPASKGHSRVRNVLLAHSKCNREKDDREPTGCELLLLEAVNAKLTIWEDA
jgi:5-methylcytosine-specific restriction endonuclease McrA